MKTSITTRITLAVVGMHAVLLPLLYYGFSVVIGSSLEGVFVQHVRTFARNLADDMEFGDVIESPKRVADFLDLAILNGEGVYAELLDNGRSQKSALNRPQSRWPGRQDFGFDESGDLTYYIELPVVREGHSAELRLGFDERPTTEQVHRVMQQTLWALAGYLAVAVAFGVVFGLQLSRPVAALKGVARRIASGNYVQSLRLRSGIRELHELGADLENMRETLVGVNQRLQAEIAERERTEVRRMELESRLRHRHRVETVGTLAGGIAHEVNNALQPIMLLAESALRALPAGSAVREDLDEILSSAQRARQIVEKILMFSRKAGVAELETIDLEGVVREATRLFRFVVPASVQIRIDVAGPYAPVRADPALAVQLIMNLCTNGFQAMDGHAGTLTVALHAVRVAGGAAGPVPPGDHVVLAVTDTGHGIDAATLERIFEPFFTTRAVGSGSGLGLAVVHGIAESFGATILVDSIVGRGSTFKVFFPAAGQPAARRSVQPTTSGAET